MATSMPWLPFPFGPQQSQPSAPQPMPQIPVTPPPDHQSFSSLASMASMGHPPPLSPQLLKSFTQEVYGAGASLAGVNYLGGMNNMNMMSMGMGLSQMQLPGMAGLKPSALQAMNARSMQGTVAAGVAKQQRRRDNAASETHAPAPTTAPSTAASAASASASASASTSAATQSTAQTTETAQTEPSSKPVDATPKDATVPHTSNLGDNFASSAAAGAAADPRYIAMASRIAAYYHQRCQAVANFQQQRCQAWANMQRQKSQEMSQAAMLVVAWYIRDRIQRRRRRQKRQFRRGLSQSAAAGAAASTPATGRITKGEAVRSWVLQVPDGAAAKDNENAHSQKPRDPSEVSFDMDRDAASDKDARLYSVADNLIKSQMARIDVPMLGAISFASETESESGDDGDDDDDEPAKAGADSNKDYEVAYEETPARAGLGAGAAFTPAAPAPAKPQPRPKADEYMDDESTSCSEDSDDYDDDEDCCMESSEVVHGTAGMQPSSF